MGFMDAMMDMMIKSISKKKREQMMINMMPQMMEGIDIYEFMPKMMTDMLKDVTVDDLIALDEALAKLSEEDEVKAEVVKVSKHLSLAKNYR